MLSIAKWSIEHGINLFRQQRSRLRLAQRPGKTTQFAMPEKPSKPAIRIANFSGRRAFMQARGCTPIRASARSSPSWAEVLGCRIEKLRFRERQTRRRFQRRWRNVEEIREVSPSLAQISVADCAI